MMSTFAFRIRRATCSLLAMRSTSAGESDSAIPMPLQEWSVIPLTCVAAMPVAAVTDGSMPAGAQPADVGVYRVRLPASRARR